MNREYCFIISTMRSGSTLLKALIATRPDCSDIPETTFQDYKSVETKQKIVVLKKPAGYKSLDYPGSLPTGPKKIILIRHPYETVCSLKKMNLAMKQKNLKLNDDLFLLSYWYTIYKNIITSGILQQNNTLLVRYEDIIANPIKTTAEIFQFIGTAHPEGTDSYCTPEDYEWKWRHDDGGETIKTLKVQREQNRERTERELLNLIQGSDQIHSVLDFFGYNK